MKFVYGLGLDVLRVQSSLHRDQGIGGFGRRVLLRVLSSSHWVY